ncbi:hypothetical protein GQ44DRAFT_68476 [Phaeosphaeriaceae sp. PMI808]|nr:hypothetical protein GQ44DRAFT_68476 [Phaeosphaeriaceae sp. PMI808]
MWFPHDKLLQCLIGAWNIFNSTLVDAKTGALLPDPFTISTGGSFITGDGYTGFILNGYLTSDPTKAPFTISGFGPFQISDIKPGKGQDQLEGLSFWTSGKFLTMSDPTRTTFEFTQVLYNKCKLRKIDQPNVDGTRRIAYYSKLPDVKIFK